MTTNLKKERHSVSNLKIHLVFVTKYRNVNSLKGVSSRRYGQLGFPKPYGKPALWSPSYFVSSVGGAPIEVLKAYIQNQEKPSVKDGVLNPFF